MDCLSARDVNAAFTRAKATPMKKLDSEDQGLLMQSQEAWSEYRNKFAQFESNAAKGGTLSPQLEGKAFATVTRTRTEELRRSILFTGWESNDEDVKR